MIDIMTLKTEFLRLKNKPDITTSEYEKYINELLDTHTDAITIIDGLNKQILVLESNKNYLKQSKHRLRKKMKNQMFLMTYKDHVKNHNTRIQLNAHTAKISMLINRDYLGITKFILKFAAQKLLNEITKTLTILNSPSTPTKNCGKCKCSNHN